MVKGAAGAGLRVSIVGRFDVSIVRRFDAEAALRLPEVLFLLWGVVSRFLEALDGVAAAGILATSRWGVAMRARSVSTAKL